MFPHHCHETQQRLFNITKRIDEIKEQPRNATTTVNKSKNYGYIETMTS
jgi:hypothetical protein